MQSNLGTSEAQAMIILNPESVKYKPSYRITIIQTYYIQDNCTKRIFVHGNVAPIYMKADPFPPLTMTADSHPAMMFSSQRI